MIALDPSGGVVLLHGFTGSPRSWDDALGHAPPAWAPWRVRRPPLLGHGAPGPHPPTFEAEVDRLAGLVAADPALRRPWLVGYSLGGRVALGLLVRHGALFRGATLIGAHPGLDDAEARRARRADDARWADRLEREGLAAFVAAWESLPLFDTQRDAPWHRREAQRLVRLGHDAAGLARALRVLGLGAMPSWWAALPRVSTPIRVVVGARDPRFRALAARLAGVLPTATVAVVPGAGHNVPLERPEAVWR